MSAPRKREVRASFDGGTMSSDRGGLLGAEGWEARRLYEEL
ncbi:MAG: hypothetical protein ACRD3T_04795 [Terriglobia bacterium]